jgi:hypothetical protein
MASCSEQNISELDMNFDSNEILEILTRRSRYKVTNMVEWIHKHQRKWEKIVSKKWKETAFRE